MIFNYAKAYIKGGKEYPNLHGTVDFKESNSGILLTAQIYGLPQSDTPCSSRFFGFHIHERRILHWYYSR